MQLQEVTQALHSCCLVISDDGARQMALDIVKEARAVIAKTKSQEHQLRQRAEAAERQSAELIERCAKEVPTNWTDPLLTGPQAALNGEAGTWGCPDIERLLNGIRSRIWGLKG